MLLGEETDDVWQTGISNMHLLALITHDGSRGIGRTDITGAADRN